MKIAISFLVLALALSSCHKQAYIALADAENGMHLDRAKRVSVNNFFLYRMESELRSDITKNWHIVNEDANFVYFGQLSDINGFTMINPFYKTPKPALESLFPAWRSIEGKHVKAKVFQTHVKEILDEKLIPQCPQSYQVQYSKRQYTLNKDGIRARVNLKGKCYEKRQMSAKLNLLMDAETLETKSVSTNIN
ncbi:MAG: hypothetical protein Q4F57_06505 [Weeksellaceae bacterium]|nr:hypothetical protein [Weeksellaceae bacterium]